MDQRETIRHFLATLNYRLRGAVRGAPKSFWTYSPPGDGWKPVEIVHHINDLLRFVVRAYDKSPRVVVPVGESDAEMATFTSLIKQVDEHIEKTELTGELPGHGRKLTLAVLLQGPLSDAMTHVGQLAQLRRQAGSPISPESFMRADIKPGEFPE